jgi:hypothetical protein
MGRESSVVLQPTASISQMPHVFEQKQMHLFSFSASERCSQAIYTFHATPNIAKITHPSISFLFVHLSTNTWPMFTGVPGLISVRYTECPQLNPKLETHIVNILLLRHADTKRYTSMSNVAFWRYPVRILAPRPAVVEVMASFSVRPINTRKNQKIRPRPLYMLNYWKHR